MHERPWAASAIAIALLACDGPAQGGERLPALGASAQKITVSGISSGGYMAGQFHLAHSEWVSGIGIVAAGPYYCAQNSVRTALGPCVKGDIVVPPLVDAARAAAARKTIDPLQASRDDRIWLFHGAADETVGAGVVAAARDFYAAIAAPSNVTYVDSIAAAHGMPTRTVGVDCGQMKRPYLNACNYDAAGEMLESLRGELEPPVEPQGWLIAFDQAEFGDAGLNTTGFAYVPAACAAQQACPVHVFFHGCDQSAEVLGDEVARGAGFNEWAEANAFIVLYPQAKASRSAPLNPLGCWDWWGYSGDRYATRDGAQIKAVKAMIDRLSTPPASPP